MNLLPVFRVQMASTNTVGCAGFMWVLILSVAFTQTEQLIQNRNNIYICHMIQLFVILYTGLCA